VIIIIEMPLRPLVSVIVPAYNVDRYIGDCITDLLNQSYKNIEVIVCDDCSTDTTWEVIMEFARRDKRVRAISNETNCLVAESRNKCLELCQGSFIIIQDSDDRCEKNRVEKLFNFLISNSDIDFVSSGHYYFDLNGIYRKIRPRFSRPIKHNFLYGIPFCHAATMFRTECLRDIGGYRVSKETRRSEDYDLFMRLYARGMKGANIYDILYGYRVDKNTLSRRKFVYRIDECVVRYKGFSALGLFPQGYIYVLKPILAHILQLLKSLKRFERREKCQRYQ